MRQFFRQHIIGVFLLMVSLIAGLLTYKDYGVGWDEPLQRDIGLISYNYVFNNDKTLETYENKDYGVAFELVLICIERTFKLNDTRDIYLSRHFTVHIFFLLSAFVGYWLFYRLFRNRIIAALGFLILILHPRIYAHSFFNSKDVPFLCMILISLAIAYTAFKKDRSIWYFLLGLSLGYTTGIRIMGVMLVVFLLLFLLIDFFFSLKDGGAHKILKHFLCLIGGTCLMLYLSWPALWLAPVSNFLASIKSFSHYAWNAEVLFNGVVYKADTLPATYVPTWFGISTPVMWLAIGLVACGILLFKFLKKPGQNLKNTEERNFVLYILCFIAPVVAVIVLRSVVYDDWRHLYFIYPAFVLLVLYGISKLSRGKLKYIIASLCALQIVMVAYFMAKFHPLQQVYFNELVSHKTGHLKKQYELEYWGCSYKQGLEYILENDKSDSIRVFWSLHPIINNVMLLEPEQRKRIVLVDRGDYPYYFITNYRGRNPKDRFDHKMVYKKDVLNSTVLGVYWVVDN